MTTWRDSEYGANRAKCPSFRRRICRKIAFSRQNPKIVYWKIKDL